MKIEDEDDDDCEYATPHVEATLVVGQLHLLNQSNWDQMRIV